MTRMLSVVIIPFDRPFDTPKHPTGCHFTRKRSQRSRSNSREFTDRDRETRERDARKREQERNNRGKRGETC